MKMMKYNCKMLMLKAGLTRRARHLLEGAPGEGQGSVGVFWEIIIEVGFGLLEIQQYQQLVVRMAEGHIYSKIMEYVNYPSSETSVYELCSNHQQLRRFTDQFPHLTPQQIRTLTKAQEQKILEKTNTFHPETLYQEIARVCPDARDIRSISAEEVASRLNLYSTKLILTERPTCESESEDSWEESKSETFFGEVRFDMRLIDEENQNEKQENGMRNIFEECDHHQCWNNTEYFGLS